LLEGTITLVRLLLIVIPVRLITDSYYLTKPIERGLPMTNKKTEYQKVCEATHAILGKLCANVAPDINPLEEHELFTPLPNEDKSVFGFAEAFNGDEEYVVACSGKYALYANDLVLFVVTPMSIKKIVTLLREKLNIEEDALFTKFWMDYSFGIIKLPPEIKIAEIYAYRNNQSGEKWKFKVYITDAVKNASELLESVAQAKFDVNMMKVVRYSLEEELSQ